MKPVLIKKQFWLVFLEKLAEKKSTIKTKEINIVILSIVFYTIDKNNITITKNTTNSKRI